mgnify:CR=1 FL=1
MTRPTRQASTCGRLALGLLLAGACGWPEGLPTSAAPGHTPGEALYPEALVAGAAPVDGDLDAAVIVAVEDYAHMRDRPVARDAQNMELQYET